MNAIFLFIVGVPAIEIYFAKIAGLSTLRSGFDQLVKNEIPIYEIISGAALAFAAFLLILPGFVTDIIGFLLIIPVTRKIFIKLITSKFNKKKSNRDNVIEGNFEEKDENK